MNWWESMRYWGATIKWIKTSISSVLNYYLWIFIVYYVLSELCLENISLDEMIFFFVIVVVVPSNMLQLFVWSLYCVHIHNILESHGRLFSYSISKFYSVWTKCFSYFFLLLFLIWMCTMYTVLYMSLRRKI